MLSEKSSTQVNLVVPPIVNRQINVPRNEDSSHKHLIKLSVEHDVFLFVCFVCFFFFVSFFQFFKDKNLS